MANLTVPHRIERTAIGTAREIYQHSTFVDVIRVRDSAGKVVDLTGRTIAFVADFLVGPATAIGRVLKLSQLVAHPSLETRELDAVPGQFDLARGVVAVRIPVDLWSEKIRYGETKNVPIVVVNVVQEEGEISDPTFRWFYRRIYTVLAAIANVPG